MNITSVAHTVCTGCSCCVAACPVHCITMQPDSEGFLFPQIDGVACIGCGQCAALCPALHQPALYSPQAAYAMQGRDADTVRQSASGGAAAIITRHILQQGGTAYGCVMTPSLKVCHQRAQTQQEALQFQGSKYVQSDFSAVYTNLQRDCASGHRVIVLGTPCQLAGVRAFLKKEYENLLLVDLICHGVPSPWLFEQYIQWLEQKMHGPVTSYVFRDKSVWKWGSSYRAVAKTEKRKSVRIATADPYYYAFTYAETYRESCYHCAYACKQRVSDITIGDYWGIEKRHPQTGFALKDGVSAVLLNTEKGLRFYQSLLPEMHSIPTDVESVVRGNSNLRRPAFRPAVRNGFYRQIQENGFVWADRHMRRQKRYYIEVAKRAVPRQVRKALKKILHR